MILLVVLRLPAEEGSKCFSFAADSARRRRVRVLAYSSTLEFRYTISIFHLYCFRDPACEPRQNRKCRIGGQKSARFAFATEILTCWSSFPAFLAASHARPLSNKSTLFHFRGPVAAFVSVLARRQQTVADGALPGQYRVQQAEVGRKNKDEDQVSDARTGHGERTRLAS